MEQSFWELLTEVNWKLIVLTLLAGGILSIIGDRIGMKFAKRRVTLWGLRPKYTSSILTAATGTMISLFVIVILAIVSESVRTSLFSMQFIQRQIVDLTKQLQESRNEQQVSSLLIVEAQQQLDRKQKELNGKQNELDSKQRELSEMQLRSDELRQATERLAAERASLEEDVKRIRDNLGRLQEGRIVAFSDERLAQEVIPEGTTDEAEVRRSLDRLDERVRYEVARRTSSVPASVVVEDEAESRDSAVSRILAYDSRKVVRAIASHNIAAGEKVRVLYRVFESSLVFSADEPLIMRVVRFVPDLDQAEVILSFMLRRLNLMSTQSGIITDSLTGTVGGIPANDFYDAVERIAAARAPLRITLLASSDIYSEGPVSVKIIVNSAEGEPPFADEELPELAEPSQIETTIEDARAAGIPVRGMPETSLR
ncbi:MAG: DUF3084 domain-containing protein [Pyramidobacter sp.]|nr:DUF3084 domain-containing protein [Pyramidobacter sp.]